jgi:hypothetical protein
MTDASLQRLGLERQGLVASGPQHYPCTRDWAVALHARTIGGIEPAGLVWQSRVAELAEGDSLLFRDLLSLASEVFVLFGDRVPNEPKAWIPGDPHLEDLTTGEGRLFAEQIAEQLDAVIVPN